MFGRQVLRATADVIVAAPEDAPVVGFMWAMSNIDANKSSTVVFIQTEKELCTVRDGTPCEPGFKIPINLRPGESLYGYTEGEALVGYVWEIV